MTEICPNCHKPLTTRITSEKQEYEEMMSERGLRTTPLCDDCQALLSPQTGEGEYVDICRQNVEQSQAEEMEWEKEFDNKFVDWNSPSQITDYHGKETTVKAIKSFISQAIQKAVEEERERIRTEMDKYKCDFNWDFEKDKPKRKEYIALQDVLKIIPPNTHDM